MHIKFLKVLVALFPFRGVNTFFCSGIIHFLLCRHELCKSILGKPFPLGGNEIPCSFLIEVFLRLELEIY